MLWVIFILGMITMWGLSRSSAPEDPLEKLFAKYGQPQLGMAQCEAIGYRMGEANVLQSQWEAVWRQECRHAEGELLEKLMRSVPQDAPNRDAAIKAKVSEHNAAMRAARQAKATASK